MAGKRGGLHSYTVQETQNATMGQAGSILVSGTSAVTSLNSSTEGHLLQVNASGVPVFDMLQGGTF